jgi:3',5'-cyclic AMP phosphodiesterase CpdA
MDDFTPVLQIVHISDLHVTDPKTSNAVAVRSWIRNLRKWSPALAEYVEDGVAPHDPLAIGLFRDFLKQITINDPNWSQCKTWLVDTGDLTSLGDSGSLDLGSNYLNSLAQVCPDVAYIYGNHDAWPGTLPLIAAISEFAKQIQSLISRQFTVASPQLALRIPIPHGGGEVQLYLVDSVRHERFVNTLALGEVGESQLEAFKDLVNKNYSSSRRDFRILAVHHPVHYPPPRPNVGMSMKNDRDVAKALDSPTSGGAYPLAHLIISGHTHSLYPQHGSLPPQPCLCVQPDLGNDQCQFVVGTLMQLDKYRKRAQWPHQCEVLRLYYSPTDQSVLLLERLLVARRAGRNYPGTGIGPYGFVMLSEENSKVEEEITFTIN